MSVCSMNGWLCRVSVGFVVALAVCASQVALATTLITQNFNTDPADWDTDSTVAPTAIGWSDTSYASGTAGEVHAYVHRGGYGTYETDIGLLDPSSDAMQMAGRAYTTDADDGSCLVGWYNHAGPWSNYAPDDFIGVYTDGQGSGGFKMFLAYGAGGWSWGNWHLLGTVANSTQGHYTVTYDPTGNGGTGSITAQLDSNSPVTVNLASGVKDNFDNFNRFGVANVHSAGDTSDQNYYWDNLVYTSAIPEPNTLVLLTAGVIGLLAYAWRKRKA